MDDVIALYVNMGVLEKEFFFGYNPVFVSVQFFEIIAVVPSHFQYCLLVCRVQAI